MRRAVLPVCHCFTHPGARARAMLFPRVAALPGIWLLRVRRVQHALSLAGTLPRPVRAVSAGSRALGSVWASDGPVRGGGPEDPREDEEEEELLRVPPLLPFDAQRVCVLHPDVKRPAGKTPRSTAFRGLPARLLTAGPVCPRSGVAGGRGSRARARAPGMVGRAYPGGVQRSAWQQAGVRQGQLPGPDREDQGMPGYHIGFPERGEDDATDPEGAGDRVGLARVRQIHLGASHLPLQRAHQGGQDAAGAGRDSAPQVRGAVPPHVLHSCFHYLRS
ncbi:putative GTP-binding protein 6 isoform X2 [Rattus norvegicus]|uniref:putative GTP-binding protein 6 isoform X2 n=1 Tax=Rattus norvegicus TaxID=10116 RepID=UPI0019179253|nr:putative GTP-binding protein 6 isoform X4 [Rattus norvegicus]